MTTADRNPNWENVTKARVVSRNTSNHKYSGRRPIALDHRTAELAELLNDFLARYANPRTRYQNARRLNHLFRDTGKRHPAEISTADLFRWTSAPSANNSVRQWISTARTFFAWCHRTSVIDADPTVELTALKMNCHPLTQTLPPVPVGTRSTNSQTYSRHR